MLARTSDGRRRAANSPAAGAPGSLPALKPFPLEVAAVGLIYLLDAVAILITYSRVPADHLYHVHHDGLLGGLSRVVVFSNFSAALVAIAVLLVVLDAGQRLPALVAIALCAAVFWPGVVDQADLDVKPVNAIAAAGVVLTAALCMRWRRAAGSSRWSSARGDGVRVALAMIATLVSLPWIAAELGLFLDGAPLLGRVFQTGSPGTAYGAPLPPAVHHGHHHGMDGLLLLLSALLLSRVVQNLQSRGLRRLLGAYLALMAAYGIGNIANDAWTEQVWKRGWTTWQIPNVLEPRASVAWAVLVAGAVLIYAAAARLGARPE
jgi:hypothetical protein